MPKSENTEVILNLIMDADERTEGMIPGWDLELARQKMLFFTTPAEFAADFETISNALNSKFGESGSALRERAISFMLGIAESLLSPIELHHNLQNPDLYQCCCCQMNNQDAAKLQQTAVDLVKTWAAKDNDAFLHVTSLIKLEDCAVNKGDNLFAGWARKWQDENSRDPYAAVDDYLNCFGALYQRGKYYPDLYFAREEGRTKTQFFNDYGLQAARCRRMGSRTAPDI